MSLWRVGEGPLATNEPLVLCGYVPGAFDIHAPLVLFDVIEWRARGFDPGNNRYFLIRGPWRAGSRLELVVEHADRTWPFAVEIGHTPLPAPEIALVFGAPERWSADLPFGRREGVRIPYRGRLAAGGPIARLELALGVPGSGEQQTVTIIATPGERVEGFVELPEPGYELVLGGRLTDVAGQQASFRQNAC